MRARAHWICECGWVLSYADDGCLTCRNPGCKHRKVRFAPPPVRDWKLVRFRPLSEIVAFLKQAKQASRMVM